MPAPPPFEPMPTMCRLLRKGPSESFFDVETAEPLMLSNGSGATLPLSFYRLMRGPEKDSGVVQYFYLESFGRKVPVRWEEICTLKPTVKDGLRDFLAH